jgi:hypothetical protein
MLQYLISFALHGIGMIIGFFLTGFIVPKRELVNEEEAAALEQLLDFPYMYIEDLENSPDIELSEEELLDLKNKTTFMDIPILSNKVLMFYDHETETFKYYSNSDLIYRYLNVVCRKYVLEHDCKQVYRFDTLSTLTVTEPSVSVAPLNSPFVQSQKADRPMLDKKINKFVRLGTLEDYERSKELKPVVDVGILEFMKLKSS